TARQLVRELEAEYILPPGAPGRRPDRDLADALARARGDLAALLDATRGQFPDFMPAVTGLAGVLGGIPPRGAPIAPVLTSQGGAVFVVPHGSAAVPADDVVPLDTFTDAALGELLGGRTGNHQAGGWFDVYPRRGGDRDRWLRMVVATGQAIWDSVL